MRRIINKIIHGEIGLVYAEGIYSNKKHKGILLEVISRHVLSAKKHTEKIWLGMEVASKLKIIPRDYELRTDQEIDDYINHHIINKTISMNSSLRRKIRF